MSSELIVVMMKGALMALSLSLVGLLLFYILNIIKKVLFKAKKTVTPLSKAVYNHSKDIVNDIKPAINEYKEKHSITKTENEMTQSLNSEINEDEIYEKIMIEIEEDKKVKSTWAKALAQSDGDKDKAESIYIKFRFNEIKNETYKDIELLKMKEINKQKEEKSSFDIAKEKYLNNYDKRKNEKESKIKLETFLKKEELIIIDTISDLEVIAKNKSNPLKLKLKYSNSNWYVDEIITNQ